MSSILEVNLLDEWINELNVQKWKHTLHNNFYFTQIDFITHTLREFFPLKDFIINSKSNRKWNFIKSILQTNSLGSLIYLYELCLVLDYHRLNDYSEIFNLKKKNGDINIGEFRDRLLEVYINMIFKSVGLNVSQDDFYYTTNNKKKPLDCSLSFEGEKYLIECKKIYNKKGEFIWSLSTDIIKFLSQYSAKLKLHELFYCYIGFKTELNNDKLRYKCFEKVKSFFKKYFDEIRDTSKNVLSLDYLEDNSLFTIQIRPIYLVDKTLVLEELKQKYKSYTTIYTEADKLISGTVYLRTESYVDYSNAYEHIKKKIKNKIEQHKDCEYKKIIVIELEYIEFFDITSFKYPFTVDDLKKGILRDLVKDNISVVILFKTMTKMDMKYEFAIQITDSFNSRLCQILKELPLMKIK